MITNDAGIAFAQDLYRVEYPDTNDTTIVKDSIGAGGTRNGPQAVVDEDGRTVAFEWATLGGPTLPPAYVINSYTSLHQTYQTYVNYPGKPRADSLVRGYSYDSLGHVTFEYRLSGTGSLRYRYLYDDVGRLLAVYRNTGASCSSSVDSVMGNQYAGCSATTLVDSVTYDSAGNRRKSGDSYQAGNRLMTWPIASVTITYTYDDDGNVASRTQHGATTYFYWSATNQLDSVVAGGRRLFYEYNSFGQLVRKTVNGVIDRFFLWDGTHLIAELNTTGGRRAQYIYRDGIDQPLGIATDSGGTSKMRYTYQDVQGNVVGVVRDTSLLRYTPYTPWGLSDSSATTTLLALGDTLRLAWKGLVYEGDSTKLYYARSRWYDPQSGRFLSEDPAGVKGGSNFYAFGHNDPINHTDPFGGCPYAVGAEFGPVDLPPNVPIIQLSAGTTITVVDVDFGSTQTWRCGDDGHTWIYVPEDDDSGNNGGGGGGGGGSAWDDGSDGSSSSSTSVGTGGGNGVGSSDPGSASAVAAGTAIAMDVRGASISGVKLLNRLGQGAKLEGEVLKTFKYVSRSGTIIGAVAGGIPAIISIYHDGWSLQNGRTVGLAVVGVLLEFSGEGEVYDALSLGVNVTQAIFDIEEASHPKSGTAIR